MTDLLDILTNALSNRYIIERELGRGGMAVVYLALDKKLGRKVALKVLRPELAASVTAERFLREIEIAAKLSHPNILALYDCGDAAGRPYYTMPYVQGESLRDRLNRERQLPVDDALRITREVADALDYAHAFGVVHRDIKPENILIESGRAVVSDFGVARAITSASGRTITGTGSIVGTPHYMSPEQAGSDTIVDGRADLYSLACVLYEMLAGEPPFTGPSSQAILAKHAVAPPPDVRTLRDTVPLSVQNAIKRALAKSPADRFNTVAAFVASASAPDRVPERAGSATTRRTFQGLLLFGALGITALIVATLAFPTIRDLVSRADVTAYPDLPEWRSWTDLKGEHFPVAVVAGSLLVVHRSGADSMYRFDGRRWTGISIPDSFAVRPYTGTVHDGRLLGTRHRRNADGIPLVQYWWLELSEDGLTPLQALGGFEPQGLLPYWWSDGRDLVTWLQWPTRYGPSGWLREHTGPGAEIWTMWGLDFTHRFAVPRAARDSLLVYDGVGWSLEAVLADDAPGRLSLSGGTTLPDGTVIVFGERCDADSGCAPLILERDRSDGRWQPVTVPAGVGMPGRQVPASANTCTAARFALLGVAGRSKEEHYVWGDWTACHPTRSGSTGAGCPSGQPCFWRVADRTLHPVEDLRGTAIANVLWTPEAGYALAYDGTVWRGTADAWRFVGRVPGLPRRLVGASPQVIARWTGGGVTYEPGVADTVSTFFRAGVPGALGGVSEAVPPRQIVVRDTTIALLTGDGSVLTSRCGITRIDVGPQMRSLRCTGWDRLPAAPGPVTAIGVLPSGGIIGVGRGGLIALWDGHAVQRERLPSGFQTDSLWGVDVAEDGTVAASSTRAVFERDRFGQWTVAREFSGVGGSGTWLVQLRNGDLVIAGRWMRVWDRASETLPLARLRYFNVLEARIGALHRLNDDRLVAGFANTDQPGVAGWLQVWAVPARQDRWERVDLPMRVDVTDLADDGVFLYVVGSGGSMAIPLASLPFGGATERR